MANSLAWIRAGGATPVLPSSVVRYIGTNYIDSGTATLPDEIGGGFDFIQPHSGFPTKVALGDGNSYVHFDNVDYNTLTCATFPTINQPFTVSILFRLNAIVSGSRLLSTGNTIFINDDGVGDIQVFTGTFWSGTSPISTGVWYASTIIVDSASPSFVNYDNVPYGMSGTVTNQSFGGASSSLIGNGNFSTKMNIDILEINMYSASLTSLQITSIYNYYKSTYPGASLP